MNGTSSMRVITLIAACAVAGASGALRGDADPPAPSAASSAKAFLAYGRQLFGNTRALMPGNVRAEVSCDSCHIEHGTVAHGLSLRGSYTRFPQWNSRAGRFIEVQDRIAECFLYSMNGKPPPYESRQMIAITAYVASLSEGVPLGSGVTGQGLIPVRGVAAADQGRAGAVFANRCAACHGSGGLGTAAAPPLWGPRSFNTGAGMFRRDTLAAFVRYNMPLGSPPNSLSSKEAVDLAAFILRHRRPRFAGQAPVIFRPEPARFF